MILPNFPTNCMKLKEFGPQGRPSRSPLDPPRHQTKFDERTILRKGVEGFFQKHHITCCLSFQELLQFNGHGNNLLILIPTFFLHYFLGSFRDDSSEKINCRLQTQAEIMKSGSDINNSQQPCKRVQNSILKPLQGFLSKESLFKTLVKSSKANITKLLTLQGTVEACVHTT